MTKLKTHYFKKIGYQLLKVDTKLFDFKVARISTQKLSTKKLRLILDKLKSLNIRLVYWQTDSRNKTSQKAALKLGGFLASIQVTYLIDLKKISPLPQKDIKVYRAQKPTTEMKRLAIQVGKPSRFGIDPKLPPKLFRKMYHLWIKNSVNGTVADQVLVVKNNNKVIGMITLGKKNKRGNIGLIAVAKNFRGKNIGTKLINAAKKYFIDNRIFKLQVVTQKSNQPACSLYEKCGFCQKKNDNFFHFWL